MSNFGTSVVRTLLPTGWGAVLGGLFAVLGLPAGTSDPHAIAVTAITASTGWAVYLVARWIESRPWCPKALVTLLLGSVHQPDYPRPPTSTGPAATVS
jgi:hypothetical protein